MKLLKKITTKALCGKIKAPAEGAGTVWLYTVYGIAHGVKTGESTYGLWEAVTGQFEAVTEDGEAFASPVCFLPEPMQGVISAGVRNGDAVEFSVRIGVEESDTQTGYEYVCAPKVEPAESDTLENLRRLSLPAPEPEQQPVKGKPARSRRASK